MWTAGEAPAAIATMRPSKQNRPATEVPAAVTCSSRQRSWEQSNDNFQQRETSYNPKPDVTKCSLSFMSVLTQHSALVKAKQLS